MGIQYGKQFNDRYNFYINLYGTLHIDIIAGIIDYIEKWEQGISPDTL